jgi:mannosyltransferase OCH1-like enzyme
MKHHDAADHRFQKQSTAWQPYSWMYNGYQQQTSKLQLRGHYLIPRLIHLICFDDTPSEKDKQLMATWKKFHPDWHIKIWTNADLASFKFRNKRAFRSANNKEEKTNIWAYEILYRFGGVYAARGFECLRAFDALHETCEFYTGISSPNTPAQVCNNLIGCKPHHPIIELCINMIRPGNGDHNPKRIASATGSLLFSHCFNRLAENFYGRIAPFPLTFFYPVPASVAAAAPVDEKVKKKWVTSSTFAIQH